MKWLIFMLIMATFLHRTQAANILALCCTLSHSHSLWCYQYMEALAERGHQITVLGVDKPTFKNPNLTTFIDTDAYDAFKSVDMGVANWFGEDSRIGAMLLFQAWDKANTIRVMRSKALKDLMKTYENITRPFDLIIHDDNCLEALLGLVPFFGNPPLLIATTFGSPQWMTSRVGDILNPSYVPTMISSYDQDMTFIERCQNALLYIFLELYSMYLTDPFQDVQMREVFGHDLPSVREIAKRSTIVIVNHHFAINGPRPLLPGVVGIAGLHIPQTKPLPQDLKDFLDEAKNGVILISFGSNLRPEMLPKELTNVIIEAVKSLPQRVLWKWNKEVPDAPANVKISNWLPQSDILAHPNLKLFITHCGLLSTQEAIYHKKPFLALPVLLDQNHNAAMMVRRNLTVLLKYRRLTVGDLHNGINEILSNPMYKTNVERLGDLMVDLPQTAKQQAVFWTEYVIRHKGAPQLRSAAADMPWHQLLLFDVLITFLLLIMFTFFVLRQFVVFLFKTTKCINPKPRTK